MADFLAALAWIAFAAFMVAAAGAALGGLLIWSLIQRSGVEPADAFDGYDEDDRTGLADDGPEDECEGAPDPLAADVDTTLEIIIPWWHGGRHRALDSRLRTAPYVTARVELHPTTEYPLLEVTG